MWCKGGLWREDSIVSFSASVSEVGKEKGILVMLTLCMLYIVLIPFCSRLPLVAKETTLPCSHIYFSFCRQLHRQSYV